ncbi:MAG: hypothetical protein ABJO01_01415 [Parasphingorhabdus sp.]|uniref:hypothetical protein n=1 Tax=Parasphingorhabdus sp. TaxID=2709688 RepID=UPI003299C5BC
MEPDKASFILEILPYASVIAVAGMGGWVINTWLRIKNGYPLEGSWGNALHPKTDQEAVERVRLVTQENAELRAEIGSMKDRLANVERIVTDESHRLTSDIEALRDNRTN